jgi:hypothetical protein
LDIVTKNYKKSLIREIFFLSKYERLNWHLKKIGNFMLISDTEEYFQKKAPKNIVPEDRSPKKSQVHRKRFFASNFVIFWKYSNKCLNLEIFLNTNINV